MLRSNPSGLQLKLNFHMCQSPQCHEFNGNVTELTDLGLDEEEGGAILQAFSPIQNFQNNGIVDLFLFVCVYQMS